MAVLGAGSAWKVSSMSYPSHAMYYPTMNEKPFLKNNKNLMHPANETYCPPVRQFVPFRWLNRMQDLNFCAHFYDKETDSETESSGPPSLIDVGNEWTPGLNGWPRGSLG